jgi:LemA protein
MYILLFLIILAITLSAYVLVVYDRVMHQHQIVKESWAYIELLLKQRTSLIAHLIQAAQGVLQHEAPVQDALNKLRIHFKRHSQHPDRIQMRIQIEAEISQALDELLAAAQKYPDLEKNEAFMYYRKGLSTMEEELHKKAEIYNPAAQSMNKLIRTYPSKYVAWCFKFKRAPTFGLTHW